MLQPQLNLWQKWTIQKLSDFGLTATMLENLDCAGQKFDMFHRDAMLYLVIKKNYTIQQALNEISGLNNHQISGILLGITKERVIKLIDKTNGQRIPHFDKQALSQLIMWIDIIADITDAKYTKSCIESNDTNRVNIREISKILEKIKKIEYPTRHIYSNDISPEAVLLDLWNKSVALLHPLEISQKQITACTVGELICMLCQISIPVDYNKEYTDFLSEINARAQDKQLPSIEFKINNAPSLDYNYLLSITLISVKQSIQQEFEQYSVPGFYPTYYHQLEQLKNIEDNQQLLEYIKLLYERKLKVPSIMGPEQEARINLETRSKITTLFMLNDKKMQNVRDNQIRSQALWLSKVSAEFPLTNYLRQSIAIFSSNYVGSSADDDRFDRMLKIAREHVYNPKHLKQP